MSGRRGRPPPRHSRSVEPAVEMPIRQTRRTTRRTEAPSKNMDEIKLYSKRATRSAGIIINKEAPGHDPFPIAQRGTKRQRRRSIESVPMEDYSSEQDGYPELEPQEGLEEEGPRDVTPVHELVEAERNQSSASMVDDNNLTSERDARTQALLEIGIPEFLRLCRKIHGQLKSIGDGIPSVTDTMRLQAFKIPFKTWRKTFANDDALFIDFRQPLFSLINRNDTASRAKAETALCSGNLVSLLTAILDTKEGKTNATPLLQELDDTFPILFDPTFQENRNDSKETFDLAFRIRCRLLAESLANSSTRLPPPLYLAAKIFCDKVNVDDADIAPDALEVGPHRQLASINVNEDDTFREAFQLHLNQLIPQISHGGKSKIQDYLNKTYSQATFVDDLQTWAMAKLDQLIAPVTTSYGNSARGGSLFVDTEEDQQVGSNSGSEDESQAIHIPEFSGPKGSFLDGSVSLADVRRSGRPASERPGMVPPSNQQAAKGKQKASNIKVAIRRLDSRQVLNTLANVDDDDDGGGGGDDDGGGIEVGQPVGNRLEHRQPKNVDISGAYPKRSQVSRQPPAESLEPVQERHGLPQSSVSAGERFQDHHLSTLTQDVRNIKRDFSTSRPRQARVHWTAQETDRLIELIAQHRCAWSTIAKAGGFEAPRDQQAVRDRARNLKVSLLIADKLLPACFDMIALGQKERDAIKKCYRNPDRKEDDVDEDGNVVNHIWVE